MTPPPVRCALQDGIAVLTIDHPPANAFSDALHDAFLAALDELDAQPVRAAIVTGTGRFFQAGGDMNRFLTIHTLAEAEAFVRKAQAFMDRIASLRYPTIAAINGYALGGGVEIALACDLRVAARDATLGLPEARYGILPGAGGTQRLARLVGAGHAKRLMYTARPIGAQEALAIGLVDQLAEPDDLLADALALAREIASNSPAAVRNIKCCVDEGLQLPLPEALALERRYWAELIPAGDYREGVSAWLERRAPRFPDPAD